MMEFHYHGLGSFSRLSVGQGGIFMEAVLKEIEQAADYLGKRATANPRIGIILGTGLGGLAERIEVAHAIPYPEIPNFPSTTVEGHAGRLLFGKCAEKDVLVMQGRVHFYEGYPLARVTFPVRVMKKIGVEILMISNAAGGLNPLFNPGDIMAITDHLNFTGQNPLIGPNLDSLGPRFPDMSAVYDRDLIRLAETAALEEKIEMQKGVYVGVTGPNLETPAETRFLRMMGADAVGMSTIPEVIVGAHCGLRILGFSAISNVNRPDCMEPAPIEIIMANAAVAGQKLIRTVEGVLKKL
jgi:purine-nucleoside phosphorylase